MDSWLAFKTTDDKSPENRGFFLSQKQGSHDELHCAILFC